MPSNNANPRNIGQAKNNVIISSNIESPLVAIVDGYDVIRKGRDLNGGALHYIFISL